MTKRLFSKVRVKTRASRRLPSKRGITKLPAKQYSALLDEINGPPRVNEKLLNAAKSSTLREPARR